MTFSINEVWLKDFILKTLDNYLDEAIEGDNGPCGLSDIAVNEITKEHEVENVSIPTASFKS